MNWKLVFSLSMFGLAMGLATVFLVPSKIEPVCWLVIFVACAVLIAKNVTKRHFTHGLCVSLVNSVWITSAHVIFFDAYAKGHADEVAMAMQMGSSPRMMMIFTGPVVGLVSGLVLGLFAFIASKVVKPTANASGA